MPCIIRLAVGHIYEIDQMDHRRIHRLARLAAVELSRTHISCAREQKGGWEIVHLEAPMK